MLKVASCLQNKLGKYRMLEQLSTCVKESFVRSCELLLIITIYTCSIILVLYTLVNSIHFKLGKFSFK